mmetsp:Transcript_33965/g.49328  ORF Transcript_33965/g.49328 Transcript_33965/m.49328 type:complete len:631 (+) Transcript_33965:82-1974(+)
MYALQILFIKLKALSIYLCIAVLCMAPIYVSSNIFAAINICGYFAEMGLTPLHHAAWNGSTEVVRLLLTGRARTDVSDKEGKTPLHHAHLTEVVTLLLTGGARTDVADKEGWTPLHWAAWGGHPEVARLLLAGGARTDVADEEGRTPLHHAINGGHKEVAGFLQRAQDGSSKYGYTPFLNSLWPDRILEFLNSDSESKARNNFSQALELVAGGFQVQPPIQVDDLLHSACRHGYWNSVRLLLRVEATLVLRKGGCARVRLSTIRDQAGLLPIHSALQSDCNMDIIVLFLEVSTGFTPKDMEGIKDLLQSTAQCPAPVTDFDTFTFLTEVFSHQSQVLPMNVHVCGDVGVGKTTIRACLDRGLRKPSKPLVHYFRKPPSVGDTPSTVGMEVSQISFENTCWTIYDYGGRPEYHVNHARYLSVPNSIYVVVLAASHFEGSKKGERYSIEELCASYYHWLKFINSTPNSSMIDCICVINFDSKISSEAKLRNDMLDGIFEIQKKFTHAAISMNEANANSVQRTFNFYGGVKFLDGQYSDEVRRHLVGSLYALLDDIAPKPVPSIRLVDNVTEYLKTNKNGVKAMRLSEFHECIMNVIPGKYRDVDSDIFKLLVSSVEANMVSRGSIMLVDGST